MHPRVGWLILVVMAVGLCGCASSIEIDSQPQGATVEVDGEEIGETPTIYTDTATVFSESRVVVRMEGYETVTATLQRDGELNTLALILGITGLAVWPLLPAWLWILEYPDYARYELPPHQPAVVIDDDTMQFILEPSKDFR